MSHTPTQTPSIEPTEETLPGASTLQEKVAALTPEVRAWQGDSSGCIHLSFQGLYDLYEKATAEAWEVRSRIAALINANLTTEEMALLKRYHCAPSVEVPISHQKPEPPQVWNRYARELTERRAQELHPGRKVLDSWVFNLHGSLGVSVVLGAPAEVSP